MKKNITRLFSVLLFTLFLVFGATAQTQIFYQDFNTGADSTALNAYGLITNSNFVATSSPSTSQFTCISGGKQSASRNVINSASSGEFQSISGGTGFNWAITRNVSIGSTPTAIKIQFNAKFDVTSTNSAPKFYFQVGNGFTNEASGYSAVPSKPANSIVNCGFSMAYANSSNGGILYLNDGTTQMNGTTNVAETYAVWTMVINKTGSALTYTDTTGASRILANNSYDLWINTTRVGSAIAATTPGVAIDQFKFGDYNTNGRASVYIDWFKILDITPASCSKPTFSTHPSTSTASTCQNGIAFNALTVAASGSPSYQWYSNSSASTTGGTLIASATSTSYVPSNATVGTKYYYCISTVSTCKDTSQLSGALTVNAAPTPTFSVQPSGTNAINSSVTYTTQAGQSSYIWSVPGTAAGGTPDYIITSGGISSTDNTVTLTWLTTGSKTVTVNYSANGCAGASPASNTTIVSASVFYNKANSDITDVTNWSTNSNGIGGTQPSDFVTAGQTFNLFNTGATMSTSWDVQGAGSKVVIGNGTNAVTFAATNPFTATAVDVSNAGTLQLQTTTIPIFGTLATGSTVDYGGLSITQVVTTTTYYNLTLSGSGTRTFSGTTSINNTFNPGSGFSANAGTIALNGTSSSQAIPAFTYNNLTVAGVDGKSTSGSLTVNGVLTMSNSFTVATGHTLSFASTATMSSTAAKVLTVNGTFDDQLNSPNFTSGSGSITVAAGGTFQMSGYASGNSGTAMALTTVNFTSGVGASGSTLLITAPGLPRIPGTVSGNVTYNMTSGAGGVFLATSPTTITGNLTINGTGASGALISQATGGSGRTLTVQGNLIMTGGRYDVAAGATTVASTLTVNGNATISGANDTLYATGASNSGGTGNISIMGNLIHSAGVLGKGAVSTVGTITLSGTSSQDVSTIGLANGVNVTLNNSTGARLLTDLSIAGTLTLTSGKLRTNGFSVIMTGTASTISGPSFGAASTSYIATCDAGGTPSTTGGLTIQNIGSTGRSTAVTFPIGPNTSSYNPFTITNTSANTSFTARVNTTAISGIAADSAVQRTWNIQPASGSPSASIAMQWSTADEGLHFTRTSASIAHYNAGAAAIDVYSSGGAASGANPYTLAPVSTSFTGYGDFGVINGIIIPATEPTVQATGASVVAGTTTMTINWTKGSDATNSVVVIKQASAVTGAPTDGISYADGGAVFGSGTNLGAANYVVYTGSGNTVTVTGLTSGVTYYVAVYAYNGSNGTENYLTTLPATTNGTTGTPTYYYVGGAGNSTNTFATANMWATTLNGTPLAGFTPTNSDVFIFDGSNLGGGYTDSVTIAPISASTVVGKILLLNNAKVNILAGGTRTMSIGNSGYSSNTTVLSIPAGSKLYISGSQNTISLAANSSANISGSFYLGNGAGNSTLVPNATGSSITVNSGAYVEANLSSSSTNPFGTSGTNLVTFASGSIYKHTKASDVFGGAAASVVSFAQGSLFWYANTSNSTAQTLSGRTFGDVRIESNWNPTSGSAGFTMYNIAMPTTGVTFTMNETGTNIHLKGNITIAVGATFKFNAASSATYYFDGTTAQTITNDGTWNLATALTQSLVVSNTAGLTIAGANGISLSSAASTSMTINSSCNLALSAGALNINAGTLLLNGTVSRTSGTINASNTGATVNITGASSLPSGLFTSNSVRNLIINRNAGVSITGDLTISTALTLTNGVVDMGSNTMIIASAAVVNRSNGWVNGNLRKNIAIGSNVSRTYEIGDASYYTPVSLTFASVSSAGDIVVKSQTPATGYANYNTAPISNNNYINRYWTISNATAITFTSYAATFNYVTNDKVGTVSESSAIAAKYTGSSWSSNATTTASSNQNTASGLTSFGVVILADACVTVTPSISISTLSDTVCSGNSVSFSAVGVNGGTAPVFQWKKNGNNIATGTSISFSANTLSTGDVITCVLTANNNCQTTATATSNAVTMYVYQSPAAATIYSQYASNTTAFTMCTIGNQIGLYPTASSKGIWSSSNPSVVSIVNASSTSSTAYVTAIANGVATVTYTVQANNSTCTTGTAITVRVAQQATPNPVTGVSSICVGNSTTFATTSTGGVFSSLGRLSINTNSGFASATLSGSTSVRYTITNAYGCSAFSSLNVTINPLPATPSIGIVPGTLGIVANGGYCKNKTFSVFGNPTGGVWGSSGAFSVTNAGVVTTAAAPGTGSVSYTYTNANGCVNSRTINASVVTCASKGVNNQLAVSNEQLVVYPNPAHSLFTINCKQLTGSGSIVVTDLYGKIVKQQALSMGTNTIDVSSFAKGMYLVSVITEQGKQTQKVIVE